MKLTNSFTYFRSQREELIQMCHTDDEDFEIDFNAEEEEKGPALEIYGTDLTALAQEGQLEDCFGRDKELSEMMEILVRRQKNNPVLVGDAGVGKTAIVELFANKIVNNLVPFVLEGRTIVSIDLARIVAGSRYRGEFELRFQRVLDEVLAQPHIIIFIDEIHNIGGAGSAEGSLDAANILKPVLSRSGFQCIGATTTKEYQKIEKDPALNRRFQPIRVKEPSIDETVKILYGLRASLEAFHNVEILPGALRLSADLSARYIYDRFLPDKAIDLIDRAAAKEVIRLTSVTEGSVIASMVNASINSIGTLRLECFRRGDTASEYIFQEIETAYRNFLLRWIESPLRLEEDMIALAKKKEEEDKELTPLSQSLFDSMKLSVLKRVDELLFSSSNPRSVLKLMKRIRRLSREKNEQIFNFLCKWDDSQESTPKMSLHRISLLLLKIWLNFPKIERTNREEREQTIRFLLGKKRMEELRNRKREELQKEFDESKKNNTPFLDLPGPLEEVFERRRNFRITIESMDIDYPDPMQSERALSIIAPTFEEESEIHQSVASIKFNQIEGILLQKEDIDFFVEEFKKEEWAKTISEFVPFFAHLLQGDDFKLTYYQFIKYFIQKIDIFPHLSEIREKLFEDPFLFVFEKDFCEEDVEYYEETFELLSELETKRIDVFKEFLRELKPVVRRGIVESLRTSSSVQMTKQ
jgi:SpoVK/Ycf46/Vps4 family AAA+-type ATPase